MPRASSQRLPEPLRRLEPEPGYPVHVADELQRLAEETDRRLDAQEGARS